MAVTSMKQLLEAGVHFGHQTRRWNPKMKKYIYGERNGIHIIDLQITVDLVEKAYDFVVEQVKQDKTVLFVGTKKQAQEVVAAKALGAASADTAAFAEGDNINFRVVPQTYGKGIVE